LQAGAGVSYSSKLDEFDLFVTRCKFAALPLKCSSGSKAPQQSQQQSQLQLQQQTQSQTSWQSQQPSQQPTQQQSQGQGSVQVQPDASSQEPQSQELMPPPKRRLPQLFASQRQQQHHVQQSSQQQQQQGLTSQQSSSQASTQQQRQQQQQQRQRPQARPKLLLVDDLPYVGDATRRARLAASLGDLAATARCPVVVVATTEEGGSGGSKGGGYSSYGAAAAGMTSKGLHKVGALCEVETCRTLGAKVCPASSTSFLTAQIDKHTSRSAVPCVQRSLCMHS
jgi:hypothetical protein